MALKRSSIVKAVDSAFKVLGDIPVVATLRRTANAYDPSTGDGAKTTTDYTITKAVFVKYENFEVDKVVVLASDIKLIIRQNDIDVLPNIATDTILHNNQVFNILRVGEDPAAATYTLQLRAV